MRCSSAPSSCRRDRLVGVLDGPVVVGPERGLERHAAAAAPGRGRLIGVVFHHRAGGAVGARELRVGQLLLRCRRARRGSCGAGRARGRPRACRVLQVVEHELLGLRAVGLELAARLEHVQRIAQLLGGHVAVSRHCAWPACSARGAPSTRGERAAAAGQRLRAQAAHRARAQALEADVGVEDLAAARVDVARADGAEARRRAASSSAPTHSPGRACRTRRRRAAA